MRAVSGTAGTDTTSPLWQPQPAKTTRRGWHEERGLPQWLSHIVFFGYGFLYAWGYVSWSTASLATRSVNGGDFDLSWLVSAAVVPALLVVLAVLGTRRDLEQSRAAYIAAPGLAALGTVLSVVYQHVGQPTLAWMLAAVSGVCTGAASALFSLLWSLALSRLDMASLETIVPVSFLASAMCAIVVPSLAQLPALVVALLLVVACAVTLDRARVWVDGGNAEKLDGAAGDTYAPEGVPAIVRMLIFGVVAWTAINIAPTSSGQVLPGNEDLVDGVDIAGVVGYSLAIAFALLIIRFAVRVDFQALASMTLPVLVLSVTLFALDSPMAQFWAGVLNVALNSCCEIILLLYFIRIAQSRPERRAFWLASGSAASYLGVLLGQLLSGWCARAGVAEADPALFGLVVVCVYALAMALIPQRSYEAQADRARRVSVEGLPEDALASGATFEHAGEGTASSSCGVESSDPIAAGVARVAARYQLSPREAEVCEYLARGRSQTYIREALFLSKNTVATHVRRIYTKLDVHSKQELIDLVEGHEE